MINNKAIIFCGHGSSSKNYKKKFQAFISKFRYFFSNYDVFDCYIEIDSPNIEECTEKVSSYSKIIFFPLFIFDGKHYERDVKDKITKLNKKIIFVEKISLGNEIFELIKSDILSCEDEEIKYLVTSCSITIKKSIYKELSEYTSRLVKVLGFNQGYFCRYGKEEKVIIELNKILKHKPGKVILHPVYLFEGYLYQKVARKFLNVINNLSVLRPISEYENFFLLLKNKLLNIK